MERTMQLSNEQVMVLIGKLTVQNEQLTYMVRGLQDEVVKLQEQIKDKEVPEEE